MYITLRSPLSLLTFGLSLLIAGSPAAQIQRTLDQRTLAQVRSVPVDDFAEIPSPPDPPETPGAWSIQLATRNGFGQTTRTLTISSAGQVACVDQPGECREKLEMPDLVVLSELV